MNCPNCGGILAPNERRSHLTCSYCGGHHFPEPNADGVRVLAEVADLNCPVCRTALTHASAANVPLLYCETCRGLLVETESFVTVIDYLRSEHDPLPGTPKPFDPAELHRMIACPSCHARMDTHPYGGPGNIVIDNCRKCLVNWLDYRELRRITRGFDIH